MANTNLPGKFVWFEHLSNDTAKASAFYTGLFGWKTEAMPMGGENYLMIQNGKDGIGGFRTAPPGVPSQWTSYLSVADVDASAKAAVTAGGKVLMPPEDHPPVGRGATLADPAGAVFSIWKSADGDRPDVEKVANGDWYWNENMSTDPKAALAFYEKVFGFKQSAMDMGPMGTYHVLEMNGKPRGGLMKQTQPNMPSFWMPYVAVADCDATAKKVGALGGQVHVEPTDIPEVGRFAILMDALGGGIAIMRPN